MMGRLCAPPFINEKKWEVIKMMILTVKKKEYKVKFGYNCFCDTDLMEKTNDLIKLLQSNTAKNDEDVIGIGKFKNLFCVVRDLLYTGFQKYNPVKTKQEIGNILDDYIDEETDEERGIFQLFMSISDELFNTGFLKKFLMDAQKEMETAPESIPEK